MEEDIPEPVFEGDVPSSLKLGDPVFLPKLNQHGSVTALPDSGGEVTVQIGVLKMKVNLADLRLVDQSKLEKKGKRRGRGSSTLGLGFPKNDEHILAFRPAWAGYHGSLAGFG